VAVTASHDAKARAYRLDLAQVVPPTPGQPSKEPMLIPFVIGLIDRDGNDLPLVSDDGTAFERGVFVLDGPSHSVTFTGFAQAPVLSLNRGFSAPIKVVANQSADDLRFLAAHDCDPFNRWQAVQTLATRELIGAVKAVRAGASPQWDEGLMTALAAILADDKLEPAFVAQVMTMPSEADIARDIGRDVDPDAIHAARAQLRTAVAARHRHALAETYRRTSGRGAYSPDAMSAGRRALRNVCLDLAAAGGASSAIAQAMRQYESADNMTDRMAALSTLSLHDVPERAAALDDFYRRFETDPLVVDKWFSLQAMIPEAQTLARVRTLTAHPAFSFANPNRLRALIGAFAQANQTQFNRADGAGYDLVADTVLALDKKNPQVAARLLSAFKSWRALEATRRARAEATLRRVAARDELSRDVQDIVSRSLGE
jgi:aminopeptidase N